MLLLPAKERSLPLPFVNYDGDDYSVSSSFDRHHISSSSGSCGQNCQFHSTKITQFSELQVELLKLGATMSKAKALVDDIENKKAFPEACRILLEDVKSLVLDADDLLDEIDMELEFNRNQVRHMVLSSRKFNISSEVGKIHQELGGLVEKLEYYCMINSGQTQLAVPIIPSTCLVDESSIIGRDPDKEKIIKMVLSDQAEGGVNVSVIPIVESENVANSVEGEAAMLHEKQYLEKLFVVNGMK
ncbi:hypothetical protein M0R45_027275 [Rubus argutus]|uniref:Disease resistance N-terminal domain-containing protein n=1 Tax=Rubus argutus TaxID=59490 RepID=A0AAW1X1Q7_RUBAR